MNRSYVVCHMLASMDGNIDGDFFGKNETMSVLSDYARIREDYQYDAILSGAVTASSLYAEGYRKKTTKDKCDLPRQDYIAVKEAESYIVIVDPEGSLQYGRNTSNRNGRISHLIVLLKEDASDEVLKELQEKKISYLFAGKKELDFPKALEKLNAMSIQRVMCTGGGVLNWSLLQQDCLDEVSIVYSPVADGRNDVARIFDRSSFNKENKSISFRTEKAEITKNGGLWVVYKIK